jgi:hypothetical protein
MARYAIVQNEKVVNVVISDSPEPSWILSASANVGDDYVGGVFVHCQPTADMRITKLAFKQRFTAAERIAIREAAKTVPEVYDFEDLVNSAAFIDLARPDTIAAVHYIEAGGLIAEGRAVEILSPPVEDIERYREP